MALKNALRFIDEIRNNDEFRLRLTSMEPVDVNEYLNTIGLNFSYDEFEDSTRYLMLRCHYEHDAMEIRDILYWYKLLIK